jgi:CHASE3 domain sensor protein
MLQYPPRTIIENIPALRRSSFDQDLAASRRLIPRGKYAVIGLPLAIVLFAIVVKVFQGRPIIDYAEN